VIRKKENEEKKSFEKAKIVEKFSPAVKNRKISRNMSQVITARLARNDAQPWGFRLQGGKDFGTPLVIQKVNTGSIADNAGLKAGDAVVRLNQTDLYNLRHKDAQDAIVRAGPQFELVVQRGGATWKPSVTPVASPIPGNYTPVTKTSLAANKQQIPASPVRSIGNKQYNTPVAMYSDETIAETLSSQAEVLAGGVLGVNFKKNEKVYNPEKSEVLKALQENDSEPEPVASSAPYQQPYQSPNQAYQQQPHPVHQQPQSHQSVTKHVHAPIDRPISNNNGGLPAGQNICADCERLIV
jgi:membrane-associated protease RseP (regulator of RpoE activity)